MSESRRANPGSRWADLPDSGGSAEDIRRGELELRRESARVRRIFERDTPLHPGRRWKCRIFGHQFHPIAAEFYAVYDCDRCGNPEGEPPSRLRLFLWRVRRAIPSAWQSARYWWRCPDCSGRCGRHDPNADHVPF